MKIGLLEHGACIRAARCESFARDVTRTVANGNYDFPASVLPLTDASEYLAAHRTARKRAAHARRLGYSHARISRADHGDDIYAINTSTPVRQGRPMAAGYLERQTFTRLADYACPRHRINEYGVFTSKRRLVGYLILYVCGDLAMISQILGHAAHLADDIMYLLATQSLLDAVEESGPLTCFYNRHDSGTDGLRYFKERLGFQPARVTWTL